MSFQPHVAQELRIDGQTYRVAANPVVPSMPYGQEGRAAFVYQLHDDSDRQWALKVFKPRFRNPSLVTTAEGLAELATLPGLGVCRRTVLCPQQHGVLLKEIPALTYAVLMPWVAGPTWFEVLWDRAPLTALQSLTLARSLVTNLMAMEQRRVAHCDLSSSNLLLPALAEPPQAAGVAFVDVEGLYAPHLSRPPELLLGTPGYAHPSLSDTSWLAEADRFAGAILLAEMLGWSVPAVREAAWQESYFESAEMQQETERYTCLLTALQSQWGSEVGRLFSRAWHSATLKDCPTFGEWLVALPEEAEARYQERPTDAKSPEGQFTEGVTRTVEVQALLEEAARLEEAEEWESALAIYQELLAEVPPEDTLAQEVQEIITRLESRIEANFNTQRQTETLFEAALRMYQQQQWAAAQELLSEVIRTAPDYVQDEWSAQDLLVEVETHLDKDSPQIPGWLLGLGGVAVVLLIGALIVFNTPLTAESARIGAVTDEATSSETLIPTASPTATVRPTDTPQPTRTPRPTKTPTPQPTAVPASAIVYSEDFEDGTADAWRDSSGTWSIEEESGNLFWSGTGPSNYPQAWLDSDLDPTLNLSSWSDYAFEVHVRFPKPGSLFICARAHGGESFYNAHLDATNNWVIFADYDGTEVNDGSNYQTFGGEDYPIRTNRWYTVRFELEGNNLRLYVDDELVTTAMRSSWDSGGIGFYMGGGTEVHFDDLRVWSLS